MADVSVVERPQRWDNPFDPDMTESDVEWVMTLQPFCDMDESGFPRNLSLRDVIRNDSRITRYREGEIIIREGDYGNSAFLVMGGTARVILSPPLSARELGRREIKKKGIWGALSQIWHNPRAPEVRDRAQYYDRATSGGLGAGENDHTMLGDIAAIMEQHRTAQFLVGDTFGEIAAMGRRPRGDTVFADSDAVLLEMRWQGFRYIRHRVGAYRDYTDRIYRERGFEAHLRETALLDRIDDDGKNRLMKDASFQSYGTFEWHSTYKTLADLTFNERLTHEPVIAGAGDYPDSLLLIRSGFCRVTENFGNSERTVGFIGRGESFGLEELAHNWQYEDEIPYQRNLRALGYVDLLVLPAVTVEEIILPKLNVSQMSTPVVAGRETDEVVEAEDGMETGLLEFMVENRFINGTATMVIDSDRCVRCDDCVRACAAAHDDNPRFVRHGMRHGKYLVINACMHCTDPVCMIGCPTGAIHRSPGEGQVVINDATCIGCAVCATSCPYNNIRMVEIRDEQGSFIYDDQSKALMQATKCDLCVDQLGGPACQRACPHDALRRINMQDLSGNWDWLTDN